MSTNIYPDLSICVETSPVPYRRPSKRYSGSSQYYHYLDHNHLHPDCSWLVDISDSEDESSTHLKSHKTGVYTWWPLLSLIGETMSILVTLVTRWRKNIMLLCIFCLSAYVIWFDPIAQGHIPEGAIDLEELEQELEIGNPVRLVTYRSPISEKIFAIPLVDKSKYSRDYVFESQISRNLKYHRLWTWANNAVSHAELFPESAEVDEIIKALQTAQIVNVDVLDLGGYEGGTSEKWVVTLEGGQKAMMKLAWEEKGDMKQGALCNYGYEMPASEVAAFHLHRTLGFRNTPYVSGRLVNLRTEVLPVASPAVMKQISLTSGNETCVTGKCFYCKHKMKMCPPDGIVEVSMVYWIPRKLNLHTYPPEYMPYSTPNMPEWKQYGFNNRTYCNKIRRKDPYDEDYYYYDLFDFSFLDTLMYHFDSKHYTVNDDSDAQGSTIRLDHGRTFCAYDRDDEQIFMAPLTQCCTLRRSTWEKMNKQRGGLMTRQLRQRLERDPLSPVLREVWYPVLERRLTMILNIMERCAKENGGWDNVLVDG